MSADDVRRYCLKCSKTSGKLVQRSAPSLERQRSTAKQRAQTKRAAVSRQKAVAKGRADDRRHIMGVDLQALMKRWARMKAWSVDGADHRMQRRLASRGSPTLIIRLGKKDYVSARAYPTRWRMTMTIPKQWTTEPPTACRLADVIFTLLHEMAHLAVPSGEHHGRLFNRALCAAAQAVWGDVVTAGIATGDGYRPSKILQGNLGKHLAATRDDMKRPDSAHQRSHSGRCFCKKEKEAP